MANTYNLYACRDVAISEAASRSDVNGAPVAVVVRDGWYRVVEDADQYELMTESGNYEPVALLEPESIQ